MIEDTLDKTMLILRGLPGSGKSSLAEMIFSSISVDVSVAMIAADDFHLDKDGVYKWDKNKVGWAHSQCQASVKSAMESDTKIIIVHNTFTKSSEIKPYTDMAKQHGYIVRQLIVENTHGNSDVHGVPESTKKIMKERFVINL